LHTQHALANYLIDQRNAHYHFTVKANQPTLLQAITQHFRPRDRQHPHHQTVSPGEHGRIEIRSIWVSTRGIRKLDFPHVGQTFCIEREVITKKSGASRFETVYGITSRPPAQSSAAQLLAINRGHWSIEACHHILDTTFDEDRSRIHAGNGPENVSRLRRFAIGIVKSFLKSGESVAGKMRQLRMNTRLVFDYLRMTRNSNQESC
jgi:predicted transposase YbfD/YdcC